jgi:hypothetical protein
LYNSRETLENGNETLSKLLSKIGRVKDALDKGNLNLKGLEGEFEKEMELNEFCPLCNHKIEK